MKVKDLIEILQKVDEDKDIFVWSGYHDNQSSNVYVRELQSGPILISDISELGKELK